MTGWWSSRRRFLGICVLGLTLLFLVRHGLTWSPDPETVAEGRELFEHVWTVDDPLSPEGDGLGPVFNERSCVACHFQGGVGGAGTNAFNVSTFEVQPTRILPERSTGAIHAKSIEPLLVETANAVRDVFPIVSGRTVTRNGCQVRTRDFDPLEIESINTPPLFGLGLVEEISDWSIRRNALSRTFGEVGREFEGDFGGTPVGRARKLDGGIGKFGWRGQFASLDDFVATACAVELGLSNPVRRQDLPHGFREDESAGMDMDRDQLRALVAFVRSLPRPEQVLPTDPMELDVVHRGEEVFAEVGCADCHTPSMGGVDGFYSDLMLHRIEDPEGGGSGYGPPPPEDDHPDDGGPIPSEWKTPPLWGVADSAPYFHDGASPTLLAAIRRHGAHGRASRERFLSAPDDDQRAVIAFLETLRAPVTAIPVSTPVALSEE